MRKSSLIWSKNFFCKVVVAVVMLLSATSLCAKTVTGKVLSASDNRCSARETGWHRDRP